MATSSLSSLLFPPPLQLPSASSTKYPCSRRIWATSTSPNPLKTEDLPASSDLPLLKIPGGYGPPLLGPVLDRQDYFYNQGRDEFFRSRIRRYKSTVFRTNMPPGPPISKDPRIIALLDGVSFQTLFDTSKVEKKDVFTGTFMPSTKLTGGYRILSYLDPSEPKHGAIKHLLFTLLMAGRGRLMPEFRAGFEAMLAGLEAELAAKGRAGFNSASDAAAFGFLGRSLYGQDPADTRLGSDGPTLVAKWVLFQLGPVLTLGLPRVADELLLRSCRLPPALVKRDYERLYEFFEGAPGSQAVFDEAAAVGIGREEAAHNLLFATCFNSFGGMKILFPSIVKWLGKAGPEVQRRLAEEVRSALGPSGELTMRALEGSMPLVASVVYEVLRVEPPVPVQYGRAKQNLVLESHDAAYEVKQGEMLMGYQPFATRDPKIFRRAEEFVADRFVGEEGKQLLKHVLWSNGPETSDPTVDNKQCAGKNFVVLVSRLLVVELFRRYDAFEVEVGTSPLGASVTLTSVKRASF